MKIIHRYILRLTLQNLAGAAGVFILLFLVFDFFDKIDNIIPEGASIWLILDYFLLKIPQIAMLTLPVAALVGTMLTIGVLSKNSEITAMRASGLPVIWIAKPLLASALALSFASILVSETVVPWANSRARDIYNIDIRKKDKSGTYSQNDFWWRSGNSFYSVDTFDSRSKTLHMLSIFTIDSAFNILGRTEASEASFVDADLGWTMRGVSQYEFTENTAKKRIYESLALPISMKPSDFYDVRSDPESMSFLQLKRFIREQSRNGLPTESYRADLYEKLTQPFVTFFAALVVLPFCLRSARTNSLSGSAIAGLVIGLTYYAVHSFSIAMGRAEIWNPFIAAIAAPVLMGLVGAILNLGAEAPAE